MNANLAGLPAAQQLSRILANANADEEPTQSAALVELVSAMACPPFDRLCASIAPGHFAADEAPYQRWRYDVKHCADIMASEKGQRLLEVRTPCMSGCAQCTLLQHACQ